VTDIEDGIPSLKRKRSSTPRTPRKVAVVKEEVEESGTFSPSNTTPARKVRKPARPIKNQETGDVEIHAPNDWAEVYALVKEMRLTGPAQNAAVDTMGCERLATETASPRDQRFHTLTALMLSSQTKDTTNALAMARLKNELPPYKEGAASGLNLENILAVDPKLLNELIWVVGFHNNKTKYIKAAAEILRDEWNSDIPDSVEGLMSLPGVGPKMAYLCLSAAWGRTEGIGVDVHVHRITNLWGWHKTKGPEETRIALQSWLPKELWREINWLLVGFGQKVCLPVGRRCGDCELGLQGLCKAAERAKVTVGRRVKEEMIKRDGEGAVEKEVVVKMEVVTEDVPVNADSESEVKLEVFSELPTDESSIKAEEKGIMHEIPQATEQNRKEQDK
jgi:endonuclease-3